MRLSIHVFVIMALSACSVVTEEVDSGGGTAEIATSITFENVFPSSLIDVDAYLLGGESRTWTTLAFTIDGVSGFQNCRLDDQITLNDDNTYNYDGGSMLCGAEDNQKLKTGMWQLNADERTLVFDQGTEQESVFYIESLTEEEIVVSSHYYSWKVVGKFSHE